MVAKFQDHMKTIQVLHDYDIDYFHYDLSLSSLLVDKSNTFSNLNIEPLLKTDYCHIG